MSSMKAETKTESKKTRLVDASNIIKKGRIEPYIPQEDTRTKKSIQKSIRNSTGSFAYAEYEQERYNSAVATENQETALIQDAGFCRSPIS